MKNFKLFLQIYYQPAAAMSNIIDRGSWVFAAIQVLLISAGFFLTINAKLDEAYRIPDFNAYLSDRVYELNDDQLNAAVRSAQTQLDSANSSRPPIPLSATGSLVFSRSAQQHFISRFCRSLCSTYRSRFFSYALSAA